MPVGVVGGADQVKGRFALEEPANALAIDMAMAVEDIMQELGPNN